MTIKEQISTLDLKQLLASLQNILTSSQDFISSQPQEKYILIFSLVILLTIFRKIRPSFWMFSIITLPATIAHELCHFIVSLITNGKPASISVWPKKIAAGSNKYIYKLGSVYSYNMRWYNSFFISFAPLLLFVVLTTT